MGLSRLPPLEPGQSVDELGVVHTLRAKQLGDQRFGSGAKRTTWQRDTMVVNCRSGLVPISRRTERGGGFFQRFEEAVRRGLVKIIGVVENGDLAPAACPTSSRSCGIARASPRWERPGSPRAGP